MVHLLHRLYGVDAPGGARTRQIFRTYFSRRIASLVEIASGSTQWRQRELKVGGTSLASRLSACLTEANWWRLIAE